MSSINQILSVANSALRASQAQVNTAAQNVANANTEGYSRQRVIQTARPGLRLPEGTLGLGVQIGGVERTRDSFLDASFRSETTKAEGFRSQADLLRRVEALTGEPGDEGLTSAIDRFFNAWSELSASPEESGARASLRQQAEALTFRFNDLATSVDRLAVEGAERLQQSTNRIRTLTDELVRINQSIVAAETGGVQSPDLRDSQDRALDELAQLLPIDVQQNNDGSVRVTVKGVGLVDGPLAKPVELESSGGEWRLRIQDIAIPLSASEGRVGGTMATLNNDLSQMRQGLDEIASALVTTVNTIHRGGTNPLGQEGIDFFDQPLDGDGNPIPVSATSFRLSAAVQASPQAIAAGVGSNPGLTEPIDPDEPPNSYLPGANDIALAISGLRDGPVGGFAQGVGNGWGEVLGNVANQIRQSQDGAQVHTSLARQADVQRTDVSGVSIDEEMVRLIQAQSAYSAAARMISTADEMLQTLLRI
ncbi:MAG: flagellar hook-associated protein FlgK [Gemmatimonadales bacterium]|nr:MAG: flagellar hook-associated protein FlgK [Gemmatimonadales bacterium]